MEWPTIDDEGIAYLGSHEFRPLAPDVRSYGIYACHSLFGFLSKGGGYSGTCSEFEAEIDGLLNATRMAADLGLDRLTVRSASTTFVTGATCLVRAGDWDQIATIARSQPGEWLPRAAQSLSGGVFVEGASKGDPGVARARLLAFECTPPSSVTRESVQRSQRPFRTNGSCRD